MIIGPPSNPKRYLLSAAARIEDLSGRFESARVRAVSAAAEGERLLCHLLRYGGTEPEVAADAMSSGHFLDARFSRNRRGHSLEDVRHDIRMVLEHGTGHVRFLCASAVAAAEPDPRADALFAALATAEDGARAYGYVPGDPANMADEEYVSAMELLGALRDAAAAASEAEALLRDVAARMSALSAAMAAAHSRGGWRPEHGPVETLWHASAHARQIASDGFSPSKPEGRRGLGAFGDLPAISFTFEKELAENIASTMRELWDIVHGHFTAAEIVALVREEGIDRRCRVSDHVGTDDLDSLATPEDAVRLYRVYLAMSDRRDNPVFVGIEELAAAMKDVGREDIGVLECRVELDGDVDFVIGECEFRVPPSRVLEVALLPGDGFGAERERVLPAPAPGL